MARLATKSSKNKTNISHALMVDVCHSKDGAMVNYQIDFSKAIPKITAGSLLHDVMNSLPTPSDKVYISLFKNVLELVMKDKKAARIMSSPISSLESIDIRTLFTIAENLIQKHFVDTDRYKSGARPSLMFRRVMKYSTALLKCGSTIEDVKFKTKFIDNSRSRKIISEIPDTGCDNNEHSAPISTLSASSAKELHDKALEHLEVRNKRIKDSCKSLISKYQSIIEHMTKLEEKPLPGQLEELSNAAVLTKTANLCALKNLSTDDLIHFYIHYFNKHNLYEINNFLKWFDSNKEIPYASELFIHDYVKALCLSTPIRNSPSKESKAAALLILSKVIVPSTVILAIRHLFQLTYSWNMGTCNSITQDMITTTSDGFHINAIKPKTSQQFNEKVSHSVLTQDKTMYLCTKILSDNMAYLKNYWSCVSDSVFCGINDNNKFPLAHPVSPTVLNKRFTTLYELPSFTSEQLRDQALNTHWLTHQDIHSLQALAGWDSIETAQAYLGQTIIKVLSEANMFDFMKKLETSIIWATGNNKLASKHGFSCDEVDKKLLFPIESSESNAKSVAENWLKDSDVKIVINNDRMNHTLRQTLFYSNHWERLLSENEKRFVVTHLPQMLMCFSLDRVIRDSAHADTYLAMERNING